MTQTDRLRAMLDERGVEWIARPDGVTEWVHDGMTCKAVDRTTVGIEHLTLLVPVLTPEQAIAATLGAGTCRVEEVESGAGWVEFQCSACGSNRIDRHDNYCPKCGRKVEE